MLVSVCSASAKDVQFVVLMYIYQEILLEKDFTAALSVCLPQSAEIGDFKDRNFKKTYARGVGFVCRCLSHVAWASLSDYST